MHRYKTTRWHNLLPIVEMSLNSRVKRGLGVSPYVYTLGYGFATTPSSDGLCEYLGLLEQMEEAPFDQKIDQKISKNKRGRSDADFLASIRSGDLDDMALDDLLNLSERSQEVDIGATASKGDDIAPTADSDIQHQLYAIADAAKSKSKNAPRGALASKITRSFGHKIRGPAKDAAAAQHSLREKKQTWTELWDSVQRGEGYFAGTQMQIAMKTGLWKLSRDLGSGGFAKGSEAQFTSGENNIDLIKALDEIRAIPPTNASTEWGTDDAIWNTLVLFTRMYAACNTDFMVLCPLPVYMFIKAPLLKEETGWVTRLRSRRASGFGTSITLALSIQQTHWICCHISACTAHPDGCAAIIDPLRLYTERDTLMKALVKKLTDAGVSTKVAKLSVVIPPPRLFDARLFFFVLSIGLS